MNYRSVAYGYLGVLIVFAGFWYEQENYLIHTEKKEELFKMIVGTQGGYGHYMYIALIYMALFLMFVFKEVDPFLTSSVYIYICFGTACRSKCFCRYGYSYK